ncbi:MAG: response regulator [Balneolales bacterium]
MTQTDIKPSYILLIEDNPDDAELTQLAFQQNNFANKIINLEDGEESLNFFFGEKPNGVEINGYPVIILLDLKLPKVDGHEILRQLKSNKATKRIPVVILTSSKEEEDIINGYDLGANSYVRKPVDYKEFVKTVNNLGVYWLAINQPIIHSK